MIAEVKQIHDVSMLDVPNRLRRLANEIEAGDYGPKNSTCVVCFLGEELCVFGYGKESDINGAHLVLAAAAVQMREAGINNRLIQNENTAKKL